MTFKIFVGMETSGMSRRAFEALGCDVFSCDTLPADDGADNHIQLDVFRALAALRRQGWIPDAGLFHPTCTMHTVAAAWAFNEPNFDKYPGVGYHQRVEAGTLTGKARHRARDIAEAEVEELSLLPFFKVVENPKGTLPTRTRLGWVNDIVQPYEFGHDASKATCLWAFDKNGNKLPAFTLRRDPALRVHGRLVPAAQAGRKVDAEGWAKGSGGPNGAAMVTHIERWANQTDKGQNNLTPSADRWKDRSETYPGIGAALAEAIIAQLKNNR